MTRNNQFDPFDPLDPTGMMKTMRDHSMNGWAKMMVELVNTDAYAEANGAMLDAWLTSSAPMRKAMDNTLSQSLANLNLPSREEVALLGQRLTSIEMRLDDMEAKFDEIISLLRSNPAQTAHRENES